VAHKITAPVAVRSEKTQHIKRCSPGRFVIAWAGVTFTGWPRIEAETRRRELVFALGLAFVSDFHLPVRQNDRHSP